MLSYIRFRLHSYLHLCLVNYKLTTIIVLSCILIILLLLPPRQSFPAVEVILEGSTISLVRDDVDVEKIQLKDSQRFLYLCLPENTAQLRLTTQLGEVCLFPKKMTRKRTDVTCEQEIFPYKKIRNIACGANDEGVLHEMYYKICFKESLKDLSIDESEGYLINEIDNVVDDNARVALQTVSIYSFCFYRNKRETAFVRYEITSVDLEDPEMPLKFETISPGHAISLFSLDNAPQCYEEKNQQLVIQYVYQDQEVEKKDYLAQQLLVPWYHLADHFSKEVTENYINVKPQWKTLRDDWKQLNMFIKEKSKIEWLKSFKNSANHIHKGFLIHSGTYKEITNDHNEPFLIGNMDTIISDHMTLRVPLFWYIFVTTISKEGIILLLPNYPKDVKPSIESVCKDICDMYNWNFVKTINENIQCCEATKELQNELMQQYVQIDKVLTLDKDVEPEKSFSLMENVLVTLAYGDISRDNSDRMKYIFKEWRVANNRDEAKPQSKTAL